MRLPLLPLQRAAEEVGNIRHAAAIADRLPVDDGDRIAALGVTGYSFEEMMKHYALFSFSLFNMAFTASMIVERTERGDNMFFQMLRGGADHVLDTGALDLLPH